MSLASGLLSIRSARRTGGNAGGEREETREMALLASLHVRSPGRRGILYCGAALVFARHRHPFHEGKAGGVHTTPVPAGALLADQAGSPKTANLSLCPGPHPWYSSLGYMYRRFPIKPVEGEGRKIRAGRDHARGSRPVTTMRKNHATNRRFRVRLPAHQPQWHQAVFANLAGRSRLVLVYDGQDFDALASGPAGLSLLTCVDGAPERWTPLLDPPTSERQYFGIMAVAPAGGISPPQGALVRCRWVYALEWGQGRLAWEALLSTLDTLRPRALAIPPEYLLLTLFAARMADIPRKAALAAIPHWGPLLEEVEEALLPLIYDFISAWSNGPSQAAAAYREVSGPLPLEEPGRKPRLASFTAVFGEAQLSSIATAERFEPAVLRVLEEVSARLWGPPADAFSGEQIALVARDPCLPALLPIPSWREADAPSGPFSSLPDLLASWRAMREKQAQAGGRRQAPGSGKTRAGKTARAPITSPAPAHRSEAPGRPRGRALLETCQALRNLALAAEETQAAGAREEGHLLDRLPQLDQICFDLAEIRVLDAAALDRAQQLLLDSAHLETMPSNPVWLQMDEPEPVRRFAPTPPTASSTGERRVAAAFFRAPWGADVLGHVPGEPRRGEGERSTPWYDWRLDLIDPSGEAIHECEYRYDQRTGTWQAAASHTCPWGTCVVEPGAPGKEPGVRVCERCEASMDYYGRWLATVLRKDVGKIVLITRGHR